MDTATLKTRLQQAHVLIAGDVMLDRYWFGDAARISPEAPVPVAKIERTEYRAGGARARLPGCHHRSGKPAGSH